MQNFLEIILIILLGLTMGSFITMASYRFAQDNKKIKDLLLRRSSCPNCHNALKIKNLIPILSWFLQKGKCSFCHKKISIRYPIIEFSSAITFLFIYLATDRVFNAQLLILCLMATLLLIMIITDLEHYFIPDITQIILFILGIIYHLITEDKYGFLYYFSSAAVFLAFGLALHYGFLFLAKKHAIGIDDIKFFTVAGFILGITQFPIFMTLAGAMGVIFGLIWQKITKDETFPFAPSLAISLMICLLFKEQTEYFLHG